MVLLWHTTWLVTSRLKIKSRAKAQKGERNGSPKMVSDDTWVCIGRAIFRLGDRLRHGEGVLCHANTYAYGYSHRDLDTDAHLNANFHTDADCHADENTHTHLDEHLHTDARSDTHRPGE